MQLVVVDKCYDLMLGFDDWVCALMLKHLKAPIFVQAMKEDTKCRKND